jgi:hypothetical protein
MKMLIVQFSDHFRFRRTEWMLSFAMVMIGSAYALIPDLFSSDYFTTMLAIMPQSYWAALVLSLGLMRVAMLTINGTWRASPAFRTIGAVFGSMLWMTLFVSAVSSERLVQSVGLWLLFCVFDTVAASDAAGDVRISREKQLSERSIIGKGVGSASNP